MHDLLVEGVVLIINIKYLNLFYFVSKIYIFHSVLNIGIIDLPPIIQNLYISFGSKYRNYRSTSYIKDMSWESFLDKGLEP